MRDNIDEMYNQGKIINDWAKNVYVKIPVVNTKGKFTGKIIKKLSNEKVKLNITAVYSAKQTMKILKKIDKVILKHLQLNPTLSISDLAELSGVTATKRSCFRF